MKKLTILLAALFIAGVMTACGGNTSSSGPGSTASVSSPQTAETGGKLSEADYKAKVKEIYTNIQTQAQGMRTVDTADVEATQKMMVDVNKAVTDGFTEMVNLVPPDTYADAHQMIKDAKDTAIEVYDLSGEFIAKAGGEDAIESSPEIDALRGKLNELLPKMKEFQETIQSITG